MSVEDGEKKKKRWSEKRKKAAEEAKALADARNPKPQDYRAKINGKIQVICDGYGALRLYCPIYLLAPVCTHTYLLVNNKIRTELAEGELVLVRGILTEGSFPHMEFVEKLGKTSIPEQKTLFPESCARMNPPGKING